MQFLMDNYIFIILIGLFLVFSLIGYLIDMLRKPKVEKIVIPEELSSMDKQKKEIDESQEVEEDIKTDNKDDLLKNYDNNLN